MAQSRHVKGKEAEKRFEKSLVHGITREYINCVNRPAAEREIGVLTPSKGVTLNALKRRI